MKKYEFNVAVWWSKEDKEWLYSVIQEFDGEPEVILYGSHPEQKGALAAISDCVGELEF